MSYAKMLLLIRC